jgi:hypothetical protein
MWDRVIRWLWHAHICESSILALWDSHTHTHTYTHTCSFGNCMSDGSLGSLHRWRSQRIAKLSVVWIARHIGYFIVAAEHLTHWTYISLSRTFLSTIWFVIIRRLQRARLRVLSYTYNTHIRIYTYIFSRFRCREKYFTAIFSRNSVLRLDDRKASTHIRRISLDCWYSHVHTHCDIFMPTYTSSHTQTVIPWLTAMRYRMQTRNIIIPLMYISHTLHTRHISSSEDTR